MTATRSISEARKRLEIATHRLSLTEQPLDDESLGGWMLWMASQLGTTVLRLGRTWGIRVEPQPYYFVRDMGPEWMHHLARSAGVNEDRLWAATLARWDTFGLKGDRSASQGHRSGPWPRNSGARFCLGCLQERAGRWRLPWHLQWSYACTIHDQLLLGACPYCGEQPFTARGPWSRRTRPGEIVVCSNRCQLPLNDPHRRPYSPEIDRRLAPPLEQVELFEPWPDPDTPENGAALHPDHPVLSAQRAIDAVLSFDTTHPEIGGVPTEPRLWFTDLATLTRMINALMFRLGTVQTTQALADADHRTSLEALVSGHLLPETTGGSEQLAELTESPLLTAAATTLAYDLLSEPTREDLRLRLGALDDFPEQNLRAGLASKAVTSVLQLAADPRTRRTTRSNRIRSEAAHVLPHSLDDLGPQPIPGRIYQPVLTRHPALTRSDLGAAAASAGLLAAGDPEWVRPSCDLLDIGHIAARVESEWDHLMRDDHQGLLLRDLLALRATLQQEGAPIDWFRRRHCFPAPMRLARRLVTPVAHELNIRHTPALDLNVSLYVWERLSGGDALLTLQGLQLPGAFRMRYRRHRTLWSEYEPSTITNLVERALLRHRLDEPIAWQPSATSGAQLATGALLGPDGAAIWQTPEPDFTRDRPGWARQQLRRSVRIRPQHPLDGWSASEVIGYALKSGAYQQQLRDALTEMTVAVDVYRTGSPVNCRTDRSPFHTVARETGQPTLQRFQPHNRLGITEFAAQLIQAYSAALAPCTASIAVIETSEAAESPDPAQADPASPYPAAVGAHREKKPTTRANR